MWTIAGGILLAVGILSLFEMVMEYLSDNAVLRRWALGHTETTIPVYYGSAMKEPAPLNRRHVLVVTSSLVGAVVVLVVGLLSGVYIQDYHLEHERTIYVMSQNERVAELPGHKYFFDSDGGTFIVVSNEPLQKPAYQLLTENIVSVPVKVRELREHGFTSVRLNYTTVSLP